MADVIPFVPHRAATNGPQDLTRPRFPAGFKAAPTCSPARSTQSGPGRAVLSAPSLVQATLGSDYASASSTATAAYAV